MATLVFFLAAVVSGLFGIYGTMSGVKKNWVIFWLMTCIATSVVFFSLRSVETAQVTKDHINAASKFARIQGVREVIDIRLVDEVAVGEAVFFIDISGAQCMAWITTDYEFLPKTVVCRIPAKIVPWTR